MNIATLRALVGLMLFFSDPAYAQVHVGEPPARLHGNEKPNPLLTAGEFEGIVRFETPAKKLVINWRFVSQLTGTTTARGVQEIHFSYWPTEVIVGSSLELIVAGKRQRGGGTCIEVLQLGTPTLIAPVGGGVPSVSSAPVLSINEIYGEATEGRDMVSHIFRQQGGSGAGLFVQFWDSKDIYLIDKGTGLYSLVASAQAAGGGVLTDPKLGESYLEAFTRNHKQMGVLYGLHSAQWDPGLGTLVLVDDTRNGTIDYITFFTEQDWETLNLSDASQYDPVN